MICPYCSETKTEVYNSRSTKKRNTLWRRRRCPACKKQFTTYECVDISNMINVENINYLAVPFSRAKLLMSLVQACDHREDDAAYWLAETVEQSLIKEFSAEQKPISAKEIREQCISVLKRFDTQALIKYLSYHLDSFDTRALQKELKRPK